ncbi:MAG: 1-acyl-sn-glycerol-3-phosphate acyltransferase [Candidatus Omnitrophica bacterium CG11_big_fil_rev_8_21_14_0_20_45_26]|uniref:1-acyl-sn-glycerol-3-phosphate acyltransferase n=1 Tax=Candidatus Abzuiibacterium crystallinum TaxID=1974748 RepID=A0A2H0LTB7_9BACT|nr:MAG: 1-acyl-sn-glycerol-3-phosphate acyltransferase [Candidatus Omnitrophica bacterium CG11_big_fil_rev_8_21_14_0_20_45_26]PIW63519.1 MAG: 1-acyl-sn-glycerol-3-phosphate acyltransferase [Candidatus Omnitrophica bacterium CG12_big_fil_rev_8_21_14_0_65_45_16]
MITMIKSKNGVCHLKSRYYQYLIMWQIIVSILCWVVIITSTALFAIAIIVTAFLLYPFDRNRSAAHQIACWWGRSFFTLSPGWKLRIQGRGFIRRHQAYVLVANHASMSDIMSIFCLNRPFKWVAKDSLFCIPFFGWAMSALGYIRLVRGEHGSIRDSMKQAHDWLVKRHVSVLFFPEGTRSKTGELGTFKQGAFKLAIQTGIPIVPIVLAGTQKALQKGSFVLASGIICRVKVLKPIETRDYQAKEAVQLSMLVKSRMEEALGTR